MSNKIIEMLERCLNGSGCDNCDYVDNYVCTNCLLQDAIDTINHQKAEIDKLQNSLAISKKETRRYAMRTSDIIKEFAEIVKANKNKLFNYIYSDRGFDEQIDDLVKEAEKALKEMKR